MSEQTSATPGPAATVAPAVSEPQRSECKQSPSAWAKKKRPADGPTHDKRVLALHFDVQFSGARSAGRWEDDWPSLSEAEFDAALKAVAELELGGHHPDGTHPRSASGTGSAGKG